VHGLKSPLSSTALRALRDTKDAEETYDEEPRMAAQGGKKAAK
jgi:hypothetical protein